MSRLSIADIDSLRANSAPIPYTVAPNTSSEFFKSAHNHEKPKSTPLDHHFSLEGQGFQGSAMKRSASPQSSRKITSLGTGRPTAEYYPWDALAFELTSMASLRNENGIENALRNGSGPEVATQTIGKHDAGYNLSLALNYGHAAESPHLLRFVTEHVELAHNPPYVDWDSEGLSPDHLRELLRTWDEEARGPRPTVLYTVPSGQNPTGATQSVERRRTIYQIAEKYDLVLIEDDPYYFLRLGDRPDGIPSYLPLDRAGRVVRLDSASNILGPGLRAGWVTARRLIIDKFLAYHEVGTVAVSGPTQLMLGKLLDETWGHQGFFFWLDRLSLSYRSRRNILLESCDRYLPGEICDWMSPEYGMFLWIKLDRKMHSQFRSQTEFEDVESKLAGIEDRILKCGLQDGVQVTKGSLFSVQQGPHG
ncbi:L-kynurenine/alpha-aminoadipate aminotransferase [Aspergillus affinis]|uniref:L-kynurenine/alpha-aminoadipate aminotransferase n=1 Tax=Aspergillus affinis TaxID=1070780 RepID=UPI0022FE099B|nr:L-kynurenine/alpha-aminoadipate aminotransferase [Aspergillus affinis]KAI9039014.1 L-kynurenine/alpha-aminoadipate aminotransferase [Aspergillus affinis]